MGSSSYLKTQVHESFHPPPPPRAFLYGDFGDYPPHSLSSGLGRVHRPQRYLSPRSGPSSQHLLSFRYQDQTFVFQVLPFGLKDSLWVFTRLVATLVAHLRLRGIHIHYYLDDWLIVAPSWGLLLSHLRETLICAQSLCFLINLEKSSLLPTQVPVFLGAVLDLTRLTARPADHRILTLHQLVQRLVSSPSAPAQLWQPVPGSLVQSQGLGCGLPLSDASSSDLPSPFPAVTGPSRPPHPSFSSGERSVHGLVVSGLPPRETLQSPSSLPYLDHGCLQPRLGRFFTPSSSFGSLVSSGLQAPHQYVGTKGSVFSSPGFRGSGFRPLRPCQVRQFDCSFLHQSPGRYPLSYAVPGYPPPSLLVPSEEDCSVRFSHSGRTESRRGLPLQRELPSVRVVPSPFGYSADHSRLLQGPQPPPPPPPRRWPLCLLSQPPSSLLCEGVRPQCSGSRRVLHPVVWLPRVRVSSVCPHPESSREGCPGSDGPSAGGALLAQETVVPSTSVASGRPPEIPSGLSRASAATYLPVPTSESFESSSHSLATLRLSGREAGLSVRAADLAARCLHLWFETRRFLRVVSQPLGWSTSRLFSLYRGLSYLFVWPE